MKLLLLYLSFVLLWAGTVPLDTVDSPTIEKIFERAQLMIDEYRKSISIDDAAIHQLVIQPV